MFFEFFCFNFVNRQTLYWLKMTCLFHFLFFSNDIALYCVIFSTIRTYTLLVRKYSQNCSFLLKIYNEFTGQHQGRNVIWTFLKLLSAWVIACKLTANAHPFVGPPLGTTSSSSFLNKLSLTESRHGHKSPIIKKEM